MQICFIRSIMTLLEYLKSDLLIKKARLKAREKMWGRDQAEKFCADDRAVIEEIERQIYELEGEI